MEKIFIYIVIIIIITYIITYITIKEGVKVQIGECPLCVKYNY